MSDRSFPQKQGPLAIMDSSYNWFGSVLIRSEGNLYSFIGFRASMISRLIDKSIQKKKLSASLH